MDTESLLSSRGYPPDVHTGPSSWTGRQFSQWRHDIDLAGWNLSRSPARISRLLKWFLAWTIASVLFAIVIDIIFRVFLPSTGYWLDLLILGGVTLPMLVLGGRYFIPMALRQERAMQRRDARNWKWARRDPLTLADNRHALKEIIGRLNRERPGVPAALFVLDLHEFQRINDACGHQVGDEVLREASRRLRSTVFAHRPPGSATDPRIRGLTLARLVRVGSDELGLWFPVWPADKSADTVAKDMLLTLEEPFKVSGLTLYVRGSVGYVIHPTGEASESDWFTRANAATQQAKRLGVGQQVAFRAELIEEMVRRHDIQQALQACLKDGDGFSLEYQPIVSIELGTLMGCEALIRWRHPEWGELSPSVFIPIAEGSDLIRPLGRWVLTQAIGQMAAWRASRPTVAMLRLKMSVNLSRAQLLDPELVPLVDSLLREHGLPASVLRLEVTESLPLDDAASLATLERLRLMGTTLALDDFGTGYSSLAALLDLPISSVKIDRQFVTGIDQCPYRQALMSGVVRVAQMMGLEVVAEGIERQAEAEKLEALGCHQIQGWYISRSLPPQAFAERWLHPARKATPAGDTQAGVLDRPGNCQAGVSRAFEPQPHKAQTACLADAERS